MLRTGFELMILRTGRSVLFNIYCLFKYTATALISSFISNPETAASLCYCGLCLQVWSLTILIFALLAKSEVSTPYSRLTRIIILPPTIRKKIVKIMTSSREDLLLNMGYEPR